MANIPELPECSRLEQSNYPSTRKLEEKRMSSRMVAKKINQGSTVNYATKLLLTAKLGLIISIQDSTIVS